MSRSGRTRGDAVAAGGRRAAVAIAATVWATSLPAAAAVDRAGAGPPSPVWGAGANVSAARARLRAAGPIWITWDVARGAVAGMLPARSPAPGTVASAAAAEAFARRFVDEHLELLAPGSAADDFVVVANDRSSGIRTVGLQQHHRGIPVLGGQISLRFVADHLVYAASQALPDVGVPYRRTPTISPVVARARAIAWVDGGAGAVTLDGGDTYVLPQHDGVEWRYREVVRVAVHGSAAADQWIVFLDAGTGEPVAAAPRGFSAATVRLDVPERRPGGPRVAATAPRIGVELDGVATTTDDAGQIDLDVSPASLTITPVGPRVAVVDEAGATASATFEVADGHTVTWSAADSEFIDAQLGAFIHTSAAIAHVDTIAPGFDGLPARFDVHVNVDATCNALSRDDQLYFYRAGACENTARLADIVHHEVGHSVHGAAIIPGVGVQHASLSEGISDYLAASMADDSAIARGFWFTDEPLRELDPPGVEWTWPQDGGEAHDEGRIIGGTLWDLRVALADKHGELEGHRLADHLWFESMRRAVDIPSMYPEVLVADDDDGSLANGTPNGCEINAAFAAHGLLDTSALGTTVEATMIDQGLRVVVVAAIPVFAGCETGGGEAELRWRLRSTPQQVNRVAMSHQDGEHVATIPSQANGEVVEYQVELAGSDGAPALFPTNRADRWYQAFFGATRPIYCVDGDTDPTTWTFTGADGAWTLGAIDGPPGGLDPTAPWDDDGVAIAQPSLYAAGADTRAIGPVIDVAGLGDVRLQYRRWLTVEDATFDRATILANGRPLWSNLATPLGIHHVDDQWRFHDLPLGEFVEDGTVQLAFSLTSDDRLQLGGWTVDGLCVVEVIEPGGEVPEPEPPDGDSTGEAADTRGAAADPDGTTGTSTGAAAQDDGQTQGCGCAVDRRDRTTAAVGLWVMVVTATRRRRREVGEPDAAGRYQRCRWLGRR